VTQDVSDDFRSGPRLDLPRRVRIPEHVGAEEGRTDTRNFSVLDDPMTERPRATEASVGQAVADKDGTVARMAGALTPNVRGERAGDGIQQRQSERRSRLRAAVRSARP